MKPPARTALLLAAALLAPLLSSCELLVARAATEFTLSVERDEVSVPRGGEGRVAVTVAKTVPIDVIPLPIVISLADAPSGVRAEEVTVAPSDDDATVVITADASAALGGPVTVELEATNGFVTKSVELRLTVVRAP